MRFFGIITLIFIFISQIHKKGIILNFDKIKLSLKESEDTLNYNRYLKNLELNTKNSTANKIAIKAPNIYIATYLKRYYTQKIANLI